MLLTCFTGLLLPPLGAAPFYQKVENPASKDERKASFGSFEFQVPRAWSRVKAEGKKIRWVLRGNKGKTLSISMEPLETKLSPLQYLMDRLGRLGEGGPLKYYGGDSTGIPFVGIEFLIQTDKEKAADARAFIAIFTAHGSKVRFVAMGDGDLLLGQRPHLKRVLFTFRDRGKPIPQRLPLRKASTSQAFQGLPSPSSPRSRPSNPGGATSKPSGSLPPAKGWAQAKVADLTLSYPKAWVKTKPSNNMRLLELHLEGPGGEGTLIAYYFGPSSGSIRMNLDRWKGQFRDARNVREKDLTGSKFKTTILSLDGVFGGGMGGKKIAGRSRLFAWITRTPKGPFYFKLVAPEKTVSAWEKDLLEVARSIR